MLSKERLEELIEQKKSIYWKFAKIKPSSWSKYTIMGNTIVKGNLKEIYSLDDLFETKEDFEWYRQFGCIERTERLKLPTWEEIKKYERFDFKDKYNHSYTLHYISGFKNLAISGWSTEYYAPATKENYTLACRKCKELFLGGKDE